jgi:LemA protein
MWIALGVVALVAAWLVVTYNGLIALRNQVRNAWHQIDVQLKRRHDLIPNLVSTVKGVMSFEQETLEKVIQARNAAISAQGVSETAQAEAGLTAALGKLFALSEAYPELKSNQNALQLQEELTATENKIAFARQFYNDLVMRFNTAQEVFPTNLMASALGFKVAESFEATALEREMPSVDLSLR